MVQPAEFFSCKNPGHHFLISSTGKRRSPFFLVHNVQSCPDGGLFLYVHTFFSELWFNASQSSPISSSFLLDGMEAQKLWLDIPNEVTFRWHFFIEAIEKRVLLKTFSIPFLIPKGF